MSVKAFYRLFSCLLIVAYLWLIFGMIHIGKQGDFTPCLSKLIFKIPCPACGTTRGIMCLLQGRFIDGFCMNPNSYPVLIGVLFASITIVIDKIKGTRLFYNSYLYIDKTLHNKFLLFSILIIEGLIWAFNIYRGI